MSHFIPHTLSELSIAGSDTEAANYLVQGISVDSRVVEQGYLFIARDGVTHKGIDFIEAAAKKGAIAAVVDKNSIGNTDLSAFTIPVFTVEDFPVKVGSYVSALCGKPSENLTVIGITGTNGKTSCAHYIAQALQALGKRVAIIGTVGNGLLGQLEVASHTTPDVVTVHQLLAKFKGQGADTVIMEVSSHALDQGRVAGVKFDVAAFTNLSRDHLDYHGSMQAYGEAKARLFTDYGIPHCVINTDDEYGRTLYKQLANRPNARFSFGINDLNGAEGIYAADLNLMPSGIEMSVVAHQDPSQSITFRSPVIGGFNASNLLLTVAVLYRLDWKGEAIATAMSTVTAVPGRMESFSAPDSASIVVDYAHTPDALEKALLACKQHCHGRLWVVFGCGGDRDTGKRAEMAKIAEQLADQIIVTSDNPRTENPHKIIDMIIAGLSRSVAHSERVRSIEDRKLAIHTAFELAAPDDVILIAGKGHEDYQEIMGVKSPFSDRQIAAELSGHSFVEGA